MRPSALASTRTRDLPEGSANRPPAPSSAVLVSAERPQEQGGHSWVPSRMSLRAGRVPWLQAVSLVWWPPGTAPARGCPIPARVFSAPDLTWAVVRLSCGTTVAAQSLEGRSQNQGCSPVCRGTLGRHCPHSPAHVSQPHGQGAKGLSISGASAPPTPESRCAGKTALGGRPLRSRGPPAHGGGDCPEKTLSTPGGEGPKQAHPGDRKETSCCSGLRWPK